LTGEHIKNVVLYYADVIRQEGCVVQENGPTRLSHAGWMCGKIVEFVDDKDYDKANRWLGFVQGILSTYEIFTIDQMREHNRSAPEHKAGRAATVDELRAELDVALFPHRDVTVGSDKGLIVVTTKRPDGIIRKHWLQVREVEDLHG
jgi:hypothetical protein